METDNLYCKACAKSFLNPGSYASHLESKKHLERAKTSTYTEDEDDNVAIDGKASVSVANEVTEKRNSSKSLEDDAKMADADDDWEDEDGDDGWWTFLLNLYDWLIDWFGQWLIDWLIDCWLIDWLLIDWLIDWLFFDFWWLLAYFSLELEDLFL